MTPYVISGLHELAYVHVELVLVCRKNMLMGSKNKVKVKVKQSRYRPGVAQRVPGS
jgi:hypothetical protein